jgi:hypothetical protein
MGTWQTERFEQVAYDKEPEDVAPAIEAASKLKHLAKEDKP